MDLASNMCEYQTKDSPDRREHYTTMSPEKHDSFREEEMSFWLDGKWALAGSQGRIIQDEVKIVCQDVAPWKTGIFLRGKVDLFAWEWVSCCWVPKRDNAGWSENFIPRCNALKNGIFLRGKVELFTGVWVSCCWIPKKDDAENEKNDYKTDEGNKEEKYKYIFWCNF